MIDVSTETRTTAQTVLSQVLMDLSTGHIIAEDKIQHLITFFDGCGHHDLLEQLDRALALADPLSDWTVAICLPRQIDTDDYPILHMI